MQTEPELHDLLRQRVDAARGDAELEAALHGVPCGIRLSVPGALVEVHPGPDGLTLSASAQDWSRVLQHQPPVGWHSFTAARRSGALVADADDLRIAQCLHALERLFEILRGQHEGAREGDEGLDLGGITGRYRTLRVLGERCTVHVESAGAGDAPLLVMLHTAGADSRQFHAVMADPGLAARWHMVAFDMPGHGRSQPPGDAWLGYRLDRARYLEAVRAALVAIGQGRKAVLMGCSMGAAMALHAARELPGLVHGAIALEAPFRSPGRRTPMLAHAQVNQAAHNPSYVRGLMGPASPLARRRHAAWIYSQGGFGMYAGDLAFYSDDFDAERDVTGLDGRRIPVELLTGSYDESATPADSRRVAALVPGARFGEMPELGHFPMTEHPRVFLGYLRPVLARIGARLHAAPDTTETTP